jgi:predicted transposase YbfD/YdcC
MRLPPYPGYLDVSVLQGCIVTVDAVGCQRETAEKTGSKEVDHFLAVKSSQGSPEEDVERRVCFTKAASEWEEEDFGHGWIESHHCFLYQDLHL